MSTTMSYHAPIAHTALPSGTITLLMADVEGSTRIWESRPSEMAAALAAMDHRLAELVSTTHGVCPIEQGEGDSFVVAFTDAADAVACALGLQHSTLSPIRLRIGLHTGDVQFRDPNKYMGPTLCRAARVRDLGHGGQTLLSGSTTELVRESLPEQAWLRDFGCLALRDLSRPERVTQLCHPLLRTDFPPLRGDQVGVAHGPRATRSIRRFRFTDVRRPAMSTDEGIRLARWMRTATS